VDRQIVLHDTDAGGVGIMDVDEITHAVGVVHRGAAVGGSPRRRHGRDRNSKCVSCWWLRRGCKRGRFSHRQRVAPHGSQSCRWYTTGGGGSGLGASHEARTERQPGCVRRYPGSPQW
jgi:hypothetical protein